MTVKNGEGYSDPTFGEAYSNIKREEHREEAERVGRINRLIPLVKSLVDIAGFEIVGRITLKNKKSGKEYK